MIPIATTRIGPTIVYGLPLIHKEEARKEIAKP
jgi:hypothetical protein